MEIYPLVVEINQIQKLAAGSWLLHSQIKAKTFDLLKQSEIVKNLARVLMKTFVCISLCIYVCVCVFDNSIYSIFFRKSLFQMYVCHTSVLC